MAEALRAALRLLPVVKSAPSQASFGACSRASAVRRRAPENQQSVLLSFPAPQQQQVLACERNLQSVTGLARFARAVLAYVGVGVSAVAANQLAGPSVVHGRELSSSGIDGMAAAEARVVWQRTAANRLIQEDTVRAPKLAHCSTQKAQDSHSFYLSNSWGSMDTKVDLPRQLSPSSHRDYRSEYFGLEETLGSRFKPGLQALAAERGSLKSGNPGYMGVTSEYSTGSELDLGWQFVVDPKPKSVLSVASEIAKPEKRTEEDDDTVSITDEEGETAVVVAREEANGSIMTQKAMMRNVEGLNDQFPKSSAECREHRTMATKQRMKEADPLVNGHSREQLPAPLKTSAKTSPVTTASSWRTANKEALAALVAQKTSEKLENCDLPTPRSKSAHKSPLESWELMVETPLQISKSLDQDLLACIFQGGEPTRLESLGLPPSPLMYTTTPESKSTPSIPAKVSQPLSIATDPAMSAVHRGSHSYSSTDNRNTSWSGGGGVTGSSVCKGSSPLGEALCHSQTRAREAEQQAEQTTKEYEKLSRLFFREASISLTYRQWVCYLKAENAWLRMYVQNHHRALWLQQTFLCPFEVLERLSSNRWKGFGNEHACYQKREHFSAVWPNKDTTGAIGALNAQDKAGNTLGYTVGFALALGLSLVGAGLVLGWSMGWILLPY